MSTPTAPFAAFSVTVTEKDYTAAAMVVSRLCGRLRWMPIVIPVGVAAVLWAAWLCRVQPIVAVFVLVAGLLLWAGVLWNAFSAEKRAARRDFAVYHALLSPATVTLWEDSMECAGERFCRRDPYAHLLYFAETASLFVVVREDGTFAVLPKHAMPIDGGRVATFLRETFARKYRRFR